MKPKLLKRVELPIIGAESGPRIIVEYTGLGLKDASVSDDAVVEVSVYLPSNGGILNQELEFGKRLTFFGETLNGRWGFYNEVDKHYRARSVRLSGETLEKALKEAEEYFDVQYSMLSNLMHERSKKVEAYEKVVSHRVVSGFHIVESNNWSYSFVVPDGMEIPKGSFILVENQNSYSIVRTHSEVTNGFAMKNVLCLINDPVAVEKLEQISTLNRKSNE